MDGVYLKPVQLEYLKTNFPNLNLNSSSHLPYSTDIEIVDKVFFSEQTIQSNEKPILWEQLWSYYIYHNKVEVTVERLLINPTTKRVCDVDP